jgi:hypothetical protein
MSTIRLILALVMLTVSVTARAAETPGGGATESTLDVLVNAIRANRKAMVAVNLTLSDAEAAAFWPVYDRYEKEMNALGDRLVTVVQDYSASFKGLSNDKAVKLVDEYLTIEADRVKVRRTYVDELAKILPGRTVARFFQLENKMDAVIRYDLAATIPVVEEESGAP